MKMRSLLKILALIAVFGCIEAGKYTSSIRAKKSSLAEYFALKVNDNTTSTTTQRKLSVIGGIAANPGQFPSAVFIHATSCSDEWYCTGTLIYYNYVITSGICIYNAEDIDVLLGEYDLSASYPNTRSKSRVRIFARQWTVHDSYVNSPFIGNLGLIQLPLFVVANLNITTIGLNLLNVNTNYVGNMATAVGWGEKSDGTEPPNLLYTTLKIISSTECYVTWNAPMTNIFCAKSPTTSVAQGLCYGDEGGPLIYQSLLIGITSFYDETCDATYPGIFTPIAPYNTWINQKMSDAVLGRFWELPSLPT